VSPVTVSGVVGRVRLGLQRLALLAGILWGVVAFALVLLLAWLLAGPQGWRQGSWGPLLLDLLLVALLAGGLYAISWVRGRWLAESRVARCVEDAAGLGPGTVQGSLELSRDLPRGVSSELAAFAERSLAERLGHAENLRQSDKGLDAPLRRRIGGWTRGALAGLAVVAPALLVAAFLTPERTLSAWGGLSSPVNLLSVPVLPPLAVEPGNAEVPRGGSARVSVRAPGRQFVTLHWQAAGDVPRSRTAGLDTEEAGFDFPTVTSPVRYWAEAPDGARTEEYSLTPIDPLFVSDLRLEVSFPPHTGRIPEEYRGEAPALTLPVGTRIRVDGRASRPLNEASLRLIAGQRTQVLDVGGSAFSALWTPLESGAYEWYFRDAQGAPPELAPRPLEIVLVPDAAPQVAFTYPAVDTILPITLQQPMTIQVADDYGVSSLELVAYRVTAAGEKGEPAVQPIEVSGASEAVANPVLDFASWELLPGDQVRYFARVTDNAPTPQTSVTKEWTLFMPGADEMRRDAQEKLEQSSELVEELARQAAQLAEETRNLELEAAAQRGAGQQGGRGRAGEPQPQGGFEQREDVRQNLQQQQDLVSEVDSLKAELDALSEAMREAGLSDPGLKQDLEELQRLLEETATPELRERLEQMESNLERMDSRQAQDMLREMRQTQEQMRQQLEESLERFRRAAVEQDFRATTAEAEELARLEKALAEAMKEGGQPELRAEQQQQLKERAEQMGANMQSLEERLRQIDEPQAAAAVEQGRQQSSEAQQAMQQAQQQARAGQNQQAGEQAQRAAQAMEQTAQSLQEAREQMADQRAEALRQALGGAAEEALALARRQSEIREQMRGANPQEMSGLRGDMGAVLQGVRAMTETVAEAMQQSGDGDRSVSERAGQAMSSLERAIESMDPRPSNSNAPGNAAESAVDALNQLALAALQKSREAGGQQGQQSGSMSEQLDGLAQQQGQLNSQSSQIAPMQLGQQALQRQLEELARQQQQVAGELGKLADEPGADQALGDLQALAMEARELAELLDGGRLDAETRQRQERLFHRLLDAGRTLEQEDEISEERESRTAGAFEARDVAPLSAETVGGLRYRLPSAAELQSMQPAERQLVIEYFERLNRETPRPARPAASPATAPPGGAPR
jgi:hypothetical protein